MKMKIQIVGKHTKKKGRKTEEKKKRRKSRRQTVPKRHQISMRSYKQIHFKLTLANDILKTFTTINFYCNFSNKSQSDKRYVLKSFPSWTQIYKTVTILSAI